MRTLIFIKGNQGVGKSIIANKLKKAMEVHTIKEAKDVSRNRQPYHESIIENVVFTSNNSFEYPEISKKLKKISKKDSRIYIELSVNSQL